MARPSLVRRKVFFRRNLAALLGIFETRHAISLAGGEPAFK
jgi:hypothetical protein